MSIENRLKALEKKTAARRTNPRCLEAVKKDRAKVLGLAKVNPDSWQAALLRAKPHRAICLCSRQSGKSTTAAGDCVATALSEPNALVLITSPTLRQSQELYRKCVALWRAMGKPIAADTVSKTTLELVNGSRIVALPGDPDTLVGFSSPRLVVVDEAARTTDELYFAVRPMLAVGAGRLVCLSTPFGQRGWFHQEWTEGGTSWHRVRVTAADCPRIPKSHLEDERRALGPKWYAEYYECSFEAGASAVFDPADILAATRWEDWMAA